MLSLLAPGAAPIERRVADILRLMQTARQGLAPSFSDPDFSTSYAHKICTAAHIVEHRSIDRLDAILAFYCNAEPGGQGFITMVAVDPALRRRGIASAMMDIAIEKANNAGLTSIRLHVLPDNFAAIESYLKSGFRKVSSTGEFIDMTVSLK